jgi:hypothetical protein
MTWRPRTILAVAVAILVVLIALVLLFPVYWD